MKKIITTALIFVLAITLQANTVVPANSKLNASLEKAFPGATKTTWTWVESKQLYLARFQFQDQEVNAYFTTDAEFFATTRYIAKAQLPLAVTKQIMADYPAHHLNTVIEYSTGSELLYYITLQGKKSVMIEATPAGNLRIFRRLKNKL